MSLGATLHPSESASDGRTIEQSVYIKKSELLDKMIQCAQCGFIVDLRKRSTGDSLGAIGSPTITTATITPPKPGTSASDSYGDPVDTKSGCPFCNSMNPQGKGRNSDPWMKENTDLSNF